jgi:hypothetical protein
MTTRAARLPARPLRLPEGAGLLLVGVPLAVVLAVVASLHPEWWRGLLAAAVAINLIVLGMKWPRAAAVATLMWLPFLALIRRLLISEAGWTQNDPLLLVGAVSALFLFIRLFVLERRAIAPDRFSKFVLLMLVIAFFGAFNPFGGGGVLGGLAGLLFLGVPLLWFFLGRELATRQTVLRLMGAVAIVAVGIGAYGLYQSQWGHLPSWDFHWFQITGYAGATAGRTEAGGIIFRPWGTFSSNSEYSAYLSFPLIFAGAMLYHRRVTLAVTIPFLALAVFLAGGRGVMALVLLTGVILTALRSRNGVVALILVVLGVGATYGAALALGPRLDRAAGLSGNALAQRQVGGLLNPLDPGQSSALGHWDNLWKAVKDGFTHPVGQGTGISNLGARVSGGGGVETDIDIGDAFLSFGLGGIVYLLIVIMAYKRAISRYLRGRPDPVLLGVIGIMVVNFGQWLQGGHYAASALMWFLLGWAVKPTPETLQAEAESAELPLRDRLERWSPFRRRGRVSAGGAR